MEPEPAEHEAASAGPGGRRQPVLALLGATARIAPQLRPGAEKLVWRIVYEAASLASRSPDAPLNYGYAGLDGDDPAPSAEYHRLALYERVAGSIDLAGLDVLEVGCGRGAGVARVFEKFAPRSITGLDLAATAIRRARSRCRSQGVRFVTGDAENLPFGAESFDAVINVESSHCYPNPLRFLEEVHRVLRPGGHLLLADIRHTLPSPDERALFAQQDVVALRQQIAEAGFTTLEEEDITANVVRALTLDTPRRLARLDNTPRFLRPYVSRLMAVEGTPSYTAFAERRLTYLRFVLQKA